MFENRYSGLDRFLHKLAFKTYDLQADFSELEDKVYKKELSGIDAGNPLFVTALPRAGTTLLLELLENTGEFASHTYRNMPFIPLPLFWSRLFSGHQKEAEAQERAHGDGMATSEDSPEAFEEILWRIFWKSRYKEDRILPWPAAPKSETAGEFKSFFRQHMRKVILSGRSRHPEAHRYLSKNNLNISRLPALEHLFPDARVLVLVRHPLAHARSLLRQHKNFLDFHREDAFSRAYMQGIGHYDFGANLRPVDFDGWLEDWNMEQTLDLEFWLRYWTAAYGCLARQTSDNIRIIDFMSLCARPEKELARIAEFAGLETPLALVGQSARITAQNLPEADGELVVSDAYRSAVSLYEDIISRLPAS